MKQTLRINTIYIITITLFLQSCGIPFFDFSGKGAKTKCLKLSTDDLTLDCNCSNQKIKTIIIYSHKDSNDFLGTKISDTILNPAINSITLPIIKDSANNRFLEIELHLTNSHHRESYYIRTKPGDFSKKQNIYSRYYSH